MDRRTFLHRSALAGGSVIFGPLHALGARVSAGEPPPRIAGYGPLVLKGDLWLPAAFNYQVLSRQGRPMSAISKNLPARTRSTPIGPTLSAA